MNEVQSENFPSLPHDRADSLCESARANGRAEMTKENNKSEGVAREKREKVARCPLEVIKEVAVKARGEPGTRWEEGGTSRRKEKRGGRFEE